jgi:hypothetical protein
MEKIEYDRKSPANSALASNKRQNQNFLSVNRAAFRYNMFQKMVLQKMRSKTYAKHKFDPKNRTYACLKRENS